MQKVISFIFSLLFAVSTQAQDAEKAAFMAVNPNAAELKFEHEEFNFGSIKQGDVVTHEFSFTNTGKEPLIITNAHGSCGCTVPEFPKNPIKRGEKAVIKVTFNSAGKMSVQDKTVTIESNAKTAVKVLHLKGVVTELPTEKTAKPN